jgi:serine/threonine protein kinase/sugar lactone lactonase YvrE
MIGQTLGHYRIESKLGEGGMGVVYRARDAHLDRPVAVKVLPPDRVADAERKRRFIQEAKAASALNHPNILHIYDIDAAEGIDFMAMEYVHGRTLDEVIGRKGLKLTETLKYAAQIADALAAAHAAGIIHRDVKPSNIMVTDTGVVKVLDFGLAKLSEAIEFEASGITQTIHPRTEEGTIVGTLAYMSPEQAEGRKLDPRSDIFSFGSVLYEMVTGHRAFQGESKLSTLSAILHKEPPPLTGATSSDIEKIIQRCMRKDPARRYQTMADLKVALEDLHEESRSGRQAVAPSGRRSTWALWSALILATVLAGLFVWRPWRTPPNIEPMRAVALTTYPGMEYFPSFSPDGNNVVFAWTGARQDNQDLYVQMIGSGSPLRLTTDPASDYNPVWSPDGKWIAFFRGPPPAPTGLRGRELRLIHPLGGTERKLADVKGQDFYPGAAFLAWSPDSSALIVTDSPGVGKPDALFVISIETGEKRPLTNPQPPVMADIGPALSPDGTSLVFVRRSTWGAGELHLLPLGKGLTAAGAPKRLTPVELGADFPVWTPDGKEIVFAAKSSLWRLELRDGSKPARIPYVGEDAIMPAISRAQPGRASRLIYVRSFADTNFWRLESPGPGLPVSSTPLQAIASTKPEYHCQFSPDCRRVVFTSMRTGDPELWTSDPDGTNLNQLTFLRAIDTNCPSWSPDGKLIAFSSTGKGEFDIYTVPVAGGKPRRLTDHPAIDLAPRFSKDGKTLYFSSMRSGDYRIWKMSVNGGAAVQVTTTQGGGGGVESGDAADLYYNTVAVVGSVWRQRLSGGEPLKILDGVVWFNWFLLDKGIYYVDRPGAETRLQYLNLATGKSTTIAHNLGEVGAGLTVSHDGRTILFTRQDSSADDLMLVENFH